MGLEIASFGRCRVWDSGVTGVVSWLPLRKFKIGVAGLSKPWVPTLNPETLNPSDLNPDASQSEWGGGHGILAAGQAFGLPAFRFRLVALG